MKIGIIGIGNVGAALGKGWAKKGHQVVFGVRNASDPKVAAAVKEVGNNARAASVPEVAGFGEVVVLATPWPAAQDAIRSAGNLSGKILFDCTNPLKADLSGLDVGFTTSAAEQVQSWAQGARVVKIFNTTGSNNMENPRYPEAPATMFYCGDDPQAKSAAKTLAIDLGFDPVDAGPLRIARLLEPLAMLWIHLAFAQNLGREFAFRLMRR
jgi:8-hydroxy-5-deazaflavin:NADPH oxidoreductase